MMKKGLIIILVLMMVLSATGMALATPNYDPVVTITSETGFFTVEQGGTLELIATSVMNKNTEDWELISQTWTGATRITTKGANVGDILNKTSPPTTLQFVSYAVFSADGKSPGLYDVEYEITVKQLHTVHERIGEGNDEVQIEVTLEGTIPVYVEPMAAPAVAAQILKFNEVQPRYGNPHNGGNFIADVAHAMGPQTMFNDVPKEVWCNDADGYVSNPDYWAEVLAFLNAHPRKPKTFECAYDWFVDNLE